MLKILDSDPASGAPGISPRWTRSDKHGIGTALSSASHVWFTVSEGILNEVYYPTIDRPQIRDLQYLVSDGETFFQGERELENIHECLFPDTMGYRIINVDPQERYQIEKQVVTNCEQNCVLIHTSLVVNDTTFKPRLFALMAPHLEVGGSGNNANIVEIDGRQILTAHKNDRWVALGASIPFSNSSCGYVGTTDGWQDLSRNFKISCSFDSVINGNVAVIGELDISQSKDFVLALAFGETLEGTIASLQNSLAVPFEKLREQFNQQWHKANLNLDNFERLTGDEAQLFAFSRNLLRAHEDKTYAGAIIASLSIPWGDFRGDHDLGGYHLVWTRDMCHSATGLLAAGIVDLPLRALKYLAANQNADGGFYQNFWVNGQPNWRGIQLDEVAFPVILAWRLHKAGLLDGFDPYEMVLKAAGYLIEHGPVTPQERWEENSGFSPSTLAAHISALVCAGAYARLKNQQSTASYFEAYADFLESHLEQWTVTTEGTLVADIPRHFIRIHPEDPSNPQANEDANGGVLSLRNQPPGAQASFAAKDIVDAGFLELVRYGIRKGGDTLIEDSLRVVDEILKVETSFGPCYRRYNHDGYGQKANGEAYQGWGYGHAWPVLTGERGHYEMAAGRDASLYIRAMEGFGSNTRLLPEQVWSLADKAEAHMFLGRPTGGAMPLAWAHAEYLQLVRSQADKRVFALIDEVFNRYCVDQRKRPSFEIWKFNRQVAMMQVDNILRIQTSAPFRLRWTDDYWQEQNDTDSESIETGHHFVDLKVQNEQSNAFIFTFFWKAEERWEGRDFHVNIAPTQK